MKKVIKKNQVIITSLAILIAVAGYLNFADVDLGVKDKEASTDSSSILEDAGYDLTDSENTSTPGEAVLTGTDSFAAQARISREQTRSQICRISLIIRILMMRKNRRPFRLWFP